MELKYKVKLAIGDWSDDGHGECDYFRFYSSHSAEDIREAYYKSEVLTQLTFRHDYENKFIEPICTDYEQNTLSEDQVEVLQQFGFDVESLRYGKKYYVHPSEMKKMILWFVGLSLENFTYKEFEDDFKEIYQYGGGNFCHQFGYGCF